MLDLCNFLRHKKAAFRLMERRPLLVWRVLH
ncbi:hypothetical protein I656_02783 [Geobacillus sp. WSUCF1]|nr:hypothetical protein I656_02783 [Geobacillus sp. WSUCF1]